MKSLRLFGLFILLMTFTASGWAVVNIGVQAPRSHTKAMKKWKAMAEYLSLEINEEVKIVPLHPAETLEAVNAGKIQFMLSNPVLALVINKRQGADFLVTMKTHAGSRFSGVIIAQKGSGIKTSADLRGKFVLSYKFRRSAAAYVFQVKHLLDHGIYPDKDFDIFREVRSTQDVIVQAVNRGLVDAGFIKSGLLEEMDREGKIDMRSIAIVDKVNDSFPHVHSTELYPEWTMTALKGASDKTAAVIRAALIKLTPDDKVCRTAKIAGFVPPEDFNELEVTLQALKLPPFE